jgi:hypothetical protein
VRETGADEVWITHPAVGMSDSPIKRVSLPVHEARGWSEATPAQVQKAQTEKLAAEREQRLVESGVSPRKAAANATESAKADVKGGVI